MKLSGRLPQDAATLTAAALPDYRRPKPPVQSLNRWQVNSSIGARQGISELFCEGKIILLFKLFERDNGPRLLSQQVQQNNNPVRPGPRLKYAFDAFEST